MGRRQIRLRLLLLLLLLLLPPRERAQPEQSLLLLHLGGTCLRPSAHPAVHPQSGPHVRCGLRVRRGSRPPGVVRACEAAEARCLRLQRRRLLRRRRLAPGNLGGGVGAGGEERDRHRRPRVPRLLARAAAAAAPRCRRRRRVAILVGGRVKGIGVRVVAQRSLRRRAPTPGGRLLELAMIRGQLAVRDVLPDLLALAADTEVEVSEWR
jgi:hypothetical protein